ncbi:MAG: poly-gamma-glutamate system protein [Candidatus Cloacimonetes bacterium]|nr:poly-gamma-glutamate system protein [Candidatus Cloacimonadota bacterium]
MFIPSAKSKVSLILLLSIAIILFLWTENSKVMRKKDYYEEKLSAAKLMQEAEQTLKNHRRQQGVFIDEVNDPNKTGLIGERITSITTQNGSLPSKLTTLNPNFAAVFVEMFKKAGIKKNDKIAISYTGSFPALNIAVLSAAEVLGLNPVITSSVGASMFGATDPDFTILDMESILTKKNILDYKSIAASVGGGQDLGRGLSKNGRDQILKAIKRNNVELIKTDNLEGNVEKKWDLYQNTYLEQETQIFVNIGGGLTSVGYVEDRQTIEPGLHRYMDERTLSDVGVMYRFAKNNVPIIHIEDVLSLADEYNLPTAPSPLPKPGTGRVFREKSFNLTIAAISLIIMIILITIVIIYDRKKQDFLAKELEQD